MPKPLRTFLAVEITPEVCQRARELIAQLQTTDARVRWVEPENLHLTLKFLGNVPAIEIPDICDAADDAICDMPAFDINVEGAGAFPTGDRPRTLWLGVKEGTEQMIELHDQLEKRLAKLGFRTEGRRFRPHLTIGRIQQSPGGVPELTRLIQEHSDFEGGVVNVSEVVVFSSELGRHGPVYEALGRAELSL